MRGLLIALTLLIPFNVAGEARAWGERGHALIADVAYARLTPTARRAVDALLAEDFSASAGCPIRSFQDAALWSDCVRQISSYRNQSPWHYDNIPLCGAADYDAYCANGNCATAAIGRAIRTLSDTSAPARDRQRALARIVHFIGDIHQPLHAANNGDRGGNDVRVAPRWPGANGARSLHAVWDSALVDYALGPDQQRAEAQVSALAIQHAGDWRLGNARSWAAESHQIAADVTYGALPTPMTCNAAPEATITLDPRYAERASPFVRTQLARASVRLAEVLNAALR